MPLIKSHGYGHCCKYYSSFDYYRISWRYDYKVKGSRLRFSRIVERDTDEKGARKFCKKWNIKFPK
jgi:hypothetical protein